VFPVDRVRLLCRVEVDVDVDVVSELEVDGA